MTTGTVPSSCRSGTAAVMTQSKQTAGGHSTLEQQPPGTLDRPAWCVVWTVWPCRRWSRHGSLLSVLVTGTVASATMTSSTCGYNRGRALVLITIASDLTGFKRSPTGSSQQCTDSKQSLITMCNVPRMLKVGPADATESVCRVYRLLQTGRTAATKSVLVYIKIDVIQHPEKHGFSGVTMPICWPIPIKVN